MHYIIGKDYKVLKGGDVFCVLHLLYSKVNGEYFLNRNKELWVYWVSRKKEQILWFIQMMFFSKTIFTFIISFN